jgi:hypothetical protein
MTRRSGAVARAIAGAIELLRSGRPAEALHLLTPLPAALRDALRTQSRVLPATLWTTGVGLADVF